MGADIHLYVEKKMRDKWVSLDKWKTNKEIYEYDGSSNDEWYDRKNVDRDDAWYSNCNYKLFAILANVRNSYIMVKHEGKVVTIKWLKTIAEPKGLPTDLSPEMQTLVGDRKMDSIGRHTASWFTLKELIDFDFNQDHPNFGYVYLWQYCEFKKQGYPEAWDWYAYQRSDSKVKPNVISNTEMEQHPYYEPMMKMVIEDHWKSMEFFELLKKADEYDDSHRKEGLGSPMTKITWVMKYRDHCPDFVDGTMQRMLEACLEADGTYQPENIRIVFWFDN